VGVISQGIVWFLSVLARLIVRFLADSAIEAYSGLIADVAASRIIVGVVDATTEMLTKRFNEVLVTLFGRHGVPGGNILRALYRYIRRAYRQDVDPLPGRDKD